MVKFNHEIQPQKQQHEVFTRGSEFTIPEQQQSTSQHQLEQPQIVTEVIGTTEVPSKSNPTSAEIIGTKEVPSKSNPATNPAPAEIIGTTEVPSKSNPASAVPKKNHMIDFRVSAEDQWKSATVTGRAGKATEKHKDWINIRLKDGTESSIDLNKAEWKELNVDPENDNVGIRTFLAIAADIKSAFLQSRPLRRNVFVQPPPESNTPSGYIWKLKRCLYGLNDAAREFFDSVKEALQMLQCQQSNLDPSIFSFYPNNQLCGIMVCHVDEFLHAGESNFDSFVMNGLAIDSWLEN